MTARAAPDGRRSPTAPPRPLSAPIATLLRDGDVDGRYMSRSEAVMATALAAAGAGWTEIAWRDALRAGGLGEWADTQRRKTGTRRPRNPADAERRLGPARVPALDVAVAEQRGDRRGQRPGRRGGGAAALRGRRDAHRRRRRRPRAESRASADRAKLAARSA